MIDIIVDEKDLSFNRLEKEIYAFGCKVACEMLKNILEALDKKIAEERDKSIYRHKGTRDTSVKTLMGEVEFSRVVYESTDDEGNKAYIYLLDQLLGFDTIGLISTNLAERIVENASIASYRNAADNVTELSGQSISHGGVWNVVQALGQKVKESETELAKAAEKNQLCGEKEVPVLFEEADGVYINIQGNDRPKSGKKLEMKVAVAYEGWKEVGKNRYELVNKVACAGFEDISEFYRIKEAMIAREYNVDEIQMRILNGDGAAWIKHGIDDTVHYQLDPFHKHKAILRSVRDEEQRKTILNLLGDNKIDDALVYIAGLANDTEDEKEQKKLKELYSYFKENRDGLIPYQKRGLDIPEPPIGLEYRNLGTMEHHICDIIAQRMKHRKASWSIEGASNLGKLLAAKASRRLNEVVEKYSKIILPEEKTHEIIEILSSSKAPKKDGKGKDGNIHKGQRPFTNYPVTNGRKAIRSMFNMRNFSDLIYR
ncbi:MAG TPA: ISLre2 family transposase [Bacillota bacterium]|nr:ISLre2 family transposase [Bacillota bacterium]